mmetsp:Transcript_18416/g.59911  ORF Transcript_18416/g.59911 Transcript_18416/m.59911 type:complete len:225 (+) Transcript_18416:3370-4044(+)
MVQGLPPLPPLRKLMDAVKESPAARALADLKLRAEQAVERAVNPAPLRITRQGPPVDRMLCSRGCFAAIIPGDSVGELVFTSSVNSFLNIFNAMLIGRLILTWFPNPPAALVSPLATICDPYLNLFRGIIPPIGGTIDLSPILAFFVLNVFQSTGAALPCEMPKEAPLALATVAYTGEECSAVAAPEEDRSFGGLWQKRVAARAAARALRAAVGLDPANDDRRP